MKQYELKAAAKQFLEDLGEKEISANFFKPDEVYNMSLPADSEQMAANLEIKY